MTANVSMSRWVKYVPHHLIEKYRELGWEIVDSLAKTPHGEFSKIGVWHGEEDPPLPPEEEIERRS
jgi:hypothetical protein